jgi:hypothetical protein
MRFDSLSKDPSPLTMPQADAVRKPRRHWLLIPYALAALAAVVWSAWWFYGRDRLVQALDLQKTALQAHSQNVAWQSRSISGFPFRYDVTLTGFSAKEPGGFSVATDKLELEAMAYQPTHWVGDAPGPVQITDGGKTLTVTGDTMRFSVSHPSEVVPRISLEGVNLKLSGAGPFAAISRFEAHLAAKDAQSASFFLRIDKATAQPDSLLSRMAPAQGVIVGLEGDVTNPAALRGGFKTAIANWAQAGGAFNIRQGGIQAGEALLSLRPSTVFASTDGSLNGELALSLTKASDAVLAMGAVGALPAQTAAVGSGIASVGSVFNLGKAKPLNVDLKFKGGQTTIEGVPIGPAPRLF